MTQTPEVTLRDLLRPREAAALIGVAVNTLKRWDDRGYLTSVRTPTGQRFYHHADVEALLTVRERGNGHGASA